MERYIILSIKNFTTPSIFVQVLKYRKYKDATHYFPALPASVCVLTNGGQIGVQYAYSRKVPFVGTQTGAKSGSLLKSEPLLKPTYYLLFTFYHSIYF